MKRRDIINRVLCEAQMIIDNHSTIRETAKHFGLNKSTIHYDMRKRLPAINPKLAERVSKVFAEHIAERASNGGRALRGRVRRSRIL